MSSNRNIIKVYFKGTHLIYSKPQYQYNHGMILYFADLNLPQAFEAHFANKPHGNSKTVIGSDNQVEIPDEYFWSGANEIYAWVYLHSDVDDGETVFEVRIPLTKRAKPSDEEPLPEQQSAIDRAIAELNHAVEQTGADVEQTNSDREAVSEMRDDVSDLKDSAEESANIATQKAQEASTSASNAEDSEQEAKGYADDAKRYAENAFSSKEIAVAKASEAEGYASDAEQAKTDAEDARSDTVQLKQDVVALKEQTDTNVTHYPKIVDGYWYVWNARQNDFVNTGVEATGEDGEKGETGNSGVYIGTEAPTDEDINVWIDTDGQPDSVTGLKYVKDDASNSGGVIEGLVNLPSNTTTGTINQAIGAYSHAEGGNLIRYINNYIAMPNTASGIASHAEGINTTASYNASHAEGMHSISSGEASHAEGYGTKASSNYQHVQGKYNVEDSQEMYADMVGNGTSDNARSNAYTLDWNGNAVYSGKVTVGSQPTNDNDLATKKYVDDNTSSLKYIKDDSSDNGGVIEGDVDNNIASGDYSHAEGYTSVANGNYSHAEGMSVASGDYAHSEGNNTNTNGNGAHSEGFSTQATGIGAHAEGSGAVATGNATHAEGLNTLASSNYQHVQGKNNIEDSNNVYAFIIGNGTASNNRSNAFAIKWDGTIVLADGTEVSSDGLIKYCRMGAYYLDQYGHTMSDAIDTIDNSALFGQIVLITSEGDCFHYAGKYFSYVYHYVWATPVIYDMEGGVAKEKYFRILTTYDLQKFEYKKIMLNNVATTSENGLMSSTDKQHLDSVYADYSSALTALGVI